MNVPLILIQDFEETEYRKHIQFNWILPNITKHLGAVYAN